MTMATKNEIFQEFLGRYLRADRARKGEILDHVTAVVGITRKAAIRKFRVLQMRDPLRQVHRGRHTYYTPDVTAALRDVWDVANEPCGELLHPLIAEYVSILKRDGMWRHSDEATGKLLAMSERTVKRRALVFEKMRGVRRGLSATKPSALKSIIPIFKGPWRDLPPGTGQIDTVAHCGNTLLGDFIYTVNYTDTATYWVIPRAQWNKGQEATQGNLAVIQKRLPVTLLHIHPDTGGEFVNWHAKGWCDEERIRFTRSEPGKKNDNMYVEERNGHVVRKYLGYERLDNPKCVPLMNELYDLLALYLNHFQAVRRTESNTRVGARYRRTYEKHPRTPYARMLAHTKVSEEVKASMLAEHETLNPLLLKQQVDTLTAKIMKIQRGHGTQKTRTSR